MGINFPDKPGVRCTDNRLAVRRTFDVSNHSDRQRSGRCFPATYQGSAASMAAPAMSTRTAPCATCLRPHPERRTCTIARLASGRGERCGTNCVYATVFWPVWCVGPYHRDHLTGTVSGCPRKRINSTVWRRAESGQCSRLPARSAGWIRNRGRGELPQRTNAHSIRPGPDPETNTWLAQTAAGRCTGRNGPMTRGGNPVRAAHGITGASTCFGAFPKHLARHQRGPRSGGQTVLKVSAYGAVPMRRLTWHLARCAANCCPRPEPCGQPILR